MSASKTILLVTIFGLGIGAGVIGSKFIGGGNSASQQAQAEAEEKPLYWSAPMDKSFRSDNPGKSPMGMDLIPVYADKNDMGDDRNLVRINPTVENNIGVRTAYVTTTNAKPIIETVGTIQIDDDNTSVVDVRTEGWIENMPVKAIGDEVRKGQLLFQIYSRPLVSAQDEYLQAFKMGRENLINATSSRLISLGMSKWEIDQLRKKGVSIRLMNIYAPRSGIVMQMGAGEGGFVKPGMTVLKIASLKTVWAIADVFADQVHQVRPGQAVYMRLSGVPGREWLGKVDYIYPTVNAKARTVQVRVSFDNKDGLLRPDMFARLTIQTNTDTPDMSISETMIIPREALIRTGRTERVIIALGNGQYQPAKVVSGQEIGDNIEILSGLRAREKIVVSSQFLIDSEASLRGTLLRLTPNDDSIENMSTKMPPEDAKGMGTIISLMSEHGMVTLQHGPIEALDWPSMAMSFITKPEYLQGLKEGDQASFTVLGKPYENGNYVLSAIEKMDMSQKSNKESNKENGQ
ncbi:MAG: efflux transporter periplasmic adaptor subunit [Alphaproteobacteria bacterium]|nr:MAG: efflux transporter periplasmic adaptor subunit [Alphaproteobacteria bacterium]